MAGKTKTETTKPGAPVAKATAAGRKSRVSPGRKPAPVKDDEPASAGGASVAPPPEAQRRPHLRAVDTAAAVAPPDATDADKPAGKAGRTGKGGAFKRQDLLEAICARTPGKRADAKVLLEVMLEELGRAIDGNAELVLAPLGKLSVKRRKPDATGPEIVTVKLRRPREGHGDDDGGETPLAASREDG